MTETLSFQEAIVMVENLSLEEQEMLIEIIQNRLNEYKRSELMNEIKQAEQEYKQGKFKRGTVEDLMAELD